ncbi:centrosome-associated protein 350 [Osmerus mordax]|uniref:centrosome-associated protein 350 n=1 Tax=Osmerus mordax TaxID=8014 RepID=UPI00350F48DD
MRSSRGSNAPVQQQHDNSREMSTAWRGLNQTKAALRHIENRLEAAPGSGVHLDVVMDTKRSARGATRKVSCRDGRRADDLTQVGGASRWRRRSQGSPDKSSRSPLRNTTQDSNVCRNTCVDFKEPLASYREATPPSQAPSLSEAHSLQGGVSSAPPRPPPDPLSQLVYQSDTRDRQTDHDLDSTRSSALDSTVVRYLNDRPALDALRTPAHTARGGAEEGRPTAQNHNLGSPGTSSGPGPVAQAETSDSTSPGSASQRLENLRRRQPDDKLEKLKERIRRQRENLEEAAERERLLGYLERPVGLAGTTGTSSSTATATVRKVAAAPPAPIYRGFNSSETKIRTPDGKVWGEDDFHNLSREIYRDLTRQLTESTQPQRQTQRKERSRDRKSSKPVRKVHKSASAPDQEAKQVISTTSWREGQKMVKMVLGPPSSLQPSSLQPSNTQIRTASDPRPESSRRSRPGSSERARGHSRGRSHNQARPPPSATPPPQSTAAPGDQAPPPSSDLLSADIRGILDDLQLESKAAEYYGPEEVSATRRRGGSGSRATSRTSVWNGVAARGSRSASPARHRQEPAAAEPAVKKRHYDADQVRQYIARQQEERRRRQADERRSQREEAERRSQRLQELYRKQREGVARGGPGPGHAPAAVAPDAPVQKRLQETYTKLLLEQVEQVELGEGPHASLSGAPAALQQRPGYQPSGESDKENKRQERPLSVSSSSDMSLSDPAPPPLSRNDLGVGVSSWLQPDRLSPAVRGASSSSAPPADHFLSQLLGLEPAGARGRNAPPAAMTASSAKTSRIEALKATAASLSTRIESEARKLAGAGTSYGSATAAGTGAILAPLPQDADEDGRWARAMSPPIREGNGGSVALEADHLALRIRKLLSAGQSAYNSDLTGLGDLHGYREKVGLPVANHASTSGHTPQRQEGGSLMNGVAMTKTEGSVQRRGNGRMEDGEEEGGPGLHDSSGGSISEGPLLSEGSLSEGDASPPANRNAGGAVPRPAERLGALDFCSGQRDGLQPLLRFQREAEGCPTLSPPLAPPPRDSRAPWEELAKGSPHSVINIFTKNHLLGQGKAVEDRPERTSPALHGSQSAGGSGDGPAYEDDFVLSRSSGASSQSKRGSSGRGASSHYEELMSRRSPYDHLTQRSAGSTPNSSPLSRGSAPISSPHSRGSAGKRGEFSDRSDATLVDDPCSPPSETPPANARRRGSHKSSAPSSAPSQAQSPYSDGTAGGAAAHSLRSLGSKKSPVTSPHQSSGGSPPGPQSPPGAGSPAGAQDNGSSSGRDTLGRGLGNGLGSGASLASAKGKATSAGMSAAPAELQYAPGVLHQRLSAELTYLESIEESVRQLGDVERLRGVSLAQQESVSLAQILKAQQQRHERDLYELKIKAEREALETQLQLEENRQRAARAQVELQESMVQSQHGALSGFQDATSKMASQQAEAARYTAEAARHIREMTELARSQIAGALGVQAAPLTSLYDQQGPQHHSLVQQLQSRTHTDSSRNEGSAGRSRPEEALSSLDSLSRTDSLPSRRPNISGGGSSQQSPSQTSSSPRERCREGAREGERGRGTDGAGSSVEEEAHTAADDSLPSDSIASLLEEKADSASVVTEYSLKFDESMTEDEIEERSFRSLLPSEAHRRGTLDRKPRPQEESEEEAANRDKASGTQNGSRQEGASMPFSSGQHSFSRFTMEMVRQYMKEEEVRGRHQSSLLRLRHRAMKDKTRTELAWLEHQKRRLRDKGEDDKMPPIRKRQRGLILKLQLEQAEIRRLQEANKAARKERQLLLKQQEDIERIRHSTLRLRERLKCAGDASPPETPVSETPADASSPHSTVHTDGHGRSPSPLSVSGSETSSIMQKLKKMRSHTDEKHCSPVHSFLSVLSAEHWASLSLCLPNLHPKLQLFISNQLVRFLTKREQQLMQRRRHAEDLLEWKQRLDQEEAEVRRMEREALAAWDRHTPRGPEGEGEGSTPGAEGRAARERGVVSVGESSPVPTESSVHTEFSGSHPPSSPSCSTAPPGSGSTHDSPASYSQEFDSTSHSPHQRSPPSEVSPGSSALPEASGVRTQPPSPRTPGQALAPDTPSAAQTEPMSDQSDIESRIRALKEELRKRKSMVYQLKKEQKKRHKERLKAQEASLLKQLESYNNFIQKTEAELSKEPDSLHATKPQINVPTVSEKPRVKPPPPDRSETSQSWKAGSEKIGRDSPTEHDDLTPLGRSRSTSLPEELSDEDPPTVTPTPVYGSPEHSNAPRDLLSPQAHSRPPSRDTQHLSGPSQKPSTELGDTSVVSSQRSEVLEELEVEGSQRSTSEGLFKMNLEERSASSRRDQRGVSLTSRLDTDDRPKPGDSPDVDDVIKSGTSLANKTPSVATEPNGPDPLDAESSLSDRSFSPDPDQLSSKRELPAKGTEASPPWADGYHEDFESSVESSPREEAQHGSKPTSSSSHAHPGPGRPVEGSPTGSPRYSSSEDREGDISEEFSQHSDTSNDSRRSGRMLDLQKQTGGSQEDTKDDVFSPKHSLSQTSPLPGIDEMPSFSVGDRVLVSSVQPGTLRFKGQTQFANGFWAGVELDKSEGSNNGTYDDVVYFLCEDRHGIFAPPDKISHLPDKFEVYADTTEDEDSFLDDLSDEEAKTSAADRKSRRGGVKDRTPQRASGGGDTAPADDVSDGPVDHQNNLTAPKDKPQATSANVKKQGERAIPNGRSRDIILELQDTPTTLYISDMDKIDWGRRSLKETTSLIEAEGREGQLKTPASEAEVRGGDALGTFADKLINTFVKDAVKQFTQIRRAKEEKITTANQVTDVSTGGEGSMVWGIQRDGLPFFLDSEQEEVSSPELCNRPESPVLGASGQEELARRLTELELSRELLDELGDEQDWFDEDFGLSTRREQQRQKQREEEEAQGGGGGGRSVLGGQGETVPVKTPPRPELPLPPKLPEQPAMVVPHTALQVEKLVHAATQEIWQGCGLGGGGTVTLTGLPVPKPSETFLGHDAKGQDQEAVAIRSYRQAVYDLTWEIIQEIYAEDPNAHQPLWRKPCRVSSSSFHRVKSPGDVTNVQDFIATEVLKLYGLKKDKNQKTDWQKMLKFGRKKRDRVDHVLVQELHEEEAQWVSYDEDELFVKMQLADGIFDALIKDTAEVFSQIQDKRSRQPWLS